MSDLVGNQDCWFSHAMAHFPFQSSMGYSGDDVLYSVAGNWDPTEPCFEVLNTQTPAGKHKFYLNFFENTPYTAKSLKFK